MRCAGYCTAGSYDTQRLFQFLQVTGTSELVHDVIHSQPKNEKGIKRDIFYFPYGVVVFWGFTLEEEMELLKLLKKFEKEHLLEFEEDEFTFSYANKLDVKDDEIILHKKDPMLKLAMSYAIAQSVKLTVFEEAVIKSVEESKQIPKALAVKGKIPLSRKQISQKMGELFLERNFVNLHTEILDTPDFFWDHDPLEPYYRRLFHYLDIGKRVDLLNRRLNLMHELFEILGNEINHQKASRLEMTIIILIVIEVVIAVLKDILHLI